LQDVAQELRRIEEEKGRQEKQGSVTPLSYLVNREEVPAVSETAETVV